MEETEYQTWRPVPGYPAYEASSLGQIRNIRTKQEKSYYSDRTGYLCCGMYDPSVRASRPRAVHRLVWAAFHEAPLEDGDVVTHINGDLTDNRIFNLRLETREISAKRAAYSRADRNKRKAEEVQLQLW